MRLEAWSEYVAPPGSRYRIHYEPDGHSVAPDANAFRRALDARPMVSVQSVDANDDRTLDADVVIYTGDSTLVQVLGTFQNDGENFWRIAYVERVDAGVPSGLGVTFGKITDAILDPLEDIGSAAAVTAKETASTVAKVGIPSTVVIGIAAAAFLLARR